MKLPVNIKVTVAGVTYRGGDEIPMDAVHLLTENQKLAIKAAEDAMGGPVEVRPKQKKKAAKKESEVK